MGQSGLKKHQDIFHFNPPRTTWWSGIGFGPYLPSSYSLVTNLLIAVSLLRHGELSSCECCWQGAVGEKVQQKPRVSSGDRKALCLDCPLHGWDCCTGSFNFLLNHTTFFTAEEAGFVRDCHAGHHAALSPEQQGSHVTFNIKYLWLLEL